MTFIEYRAVRILLLLALIAFVLIAFVLAMFVTEQRLVVTIGQHYGQVWCTNRCHLSMR